MCFSELPWDLKCYVISLTNGFFDTFEKQLERFIASTALFYKFSS